MYTWKRSQGCAKGVVPVVTLRRFARLCYTGTVFDMGAVMRRFFIVTLLIGAAYALNGCNFFSQPTDLQTENLAIEVANTEIAAVRQTATGSADRLLATLQSVETAVGSMQQQGTRIAATMVAAGMSIIDTSAITPLPNAGASPVPGDNLVTAVVGEGGARANISIQAPPTPTPIATADPNTPRLGNIVLAEQVGVDDCPLGVTTTFASAAARIYATAIAYNLTPAHLVTADFTRDGQPVVSYEWTPSFNIAQGCIWFELPATAVEFVPGNWSVQLALNGTPAGAPVNFTITADSMSSGG